jgi:hypothetical protein
MNFINRILNRFKRVQLHEQSAAALVPAHASMQMTVRRFQGRYDCGCEVDPEILQPDECVNHPGALKVFKNEIPQVQHSDVMVPANVFEED